MPKRMRATHWIVLALALIALLVVAVYLRDMGRAYARIEIGSETINSAFGPIEYAQGGLGASVLVIHGSGGGFDQGALIAEAVLGNGMHWIAPSRFAYLRSGLPAGANFDAQAHAYALLLDRLGIERVAVVALSHGGPSALLFALHYPQRVSALVLISCGVASSTDADQAQASQKGDALTTIFSHDPFYWAASRLARKPLLRLMGADDGVIAGLNPEQRALLDQIIDRMNPVAPRAAGVALDNTAEMPNARIAGIRAPTLILHARDDGLQRYRNAEFAAAMIPGARLESFERGGHLLIATEQPTIRAETLAFIRAQAARSN